MRICPKCKRQFPDNTLFCPDDGKALVQRSEGAPSHHPQPQAQAQAQKTPSWSEFDDVEDTVLDTSIEDVEAARRANRAEQAPPVKTQTPTRMEAPPSLVPPNRTTGPSAPATQPSPPTTEPAHMPMDPSNLVGERLFGEYTIIDKLGEGGMGAVYLARQDTIDQRIAVKVLHEEAAESDELIQRFHREARVVAMLTHPNIIRVFIFGRTQGGLLYLAMEYVEGETLRRVIDRGQLTEMRVIKIMKQLCSGLSEAHDLGIIHRDLKPDNVLLTEWRGESDFAKILDFGIAKLKQPDSPEAQKNLTQAGIVYGTPEYLSPEQAQALELDQRTDIYSLGCILYELMTGRVPFDDTTPVKILTAHVFTEVTPPSQVAPNKVSPTMEKIIMKAMAKDAGERFQDALEMFEALVAREQELVREQGLGGRAGYVPGMELTGMYRALDLSAPDETADITHRDIASVAGSRPHHPTASTASAPTPTKQKSSTKMVIYLLVAGIGMLFMVLLMLIGFLVLSG